MRVAIVNDMPIAREVLKRTVLSVPGYTVAWTAENGEQAIRQTMNDKPDAILMDLIMPLMDGVEATRIIMSKNPCPILLVTGSVSGNFSKVVEAMGQGGLDAVNTPTMGTGGKLVDAEQLLTKLEKIAKNKRHSNGTQSLATTSTKSSASSLVVIGSSTGGPDALSRVLSGLGASFNGSVLIAQHIDADAAKNMAKWLQQFTALEVCSVVPDMELRPRTVYVATTNDHMVLQANKRLTYVREPLNYPFRPSADILFNSVAENFPNAGVAVLLTGMGSDGAKGLLKLRQAGWLTIAQDAATCVVASMPEAAINLNAAKYVLPLEQIADSIVSYSRR